MTSKSKCFLCEGELISPEQNWCPGCRRYICDMHATIFGRHKPEDHDEGTESDLE